MRISDWSSDVCSSDRPGVPDHVSLWGLLIPIRRSFRQYVNLRPVRLLGGVDSPLKDRKPGDIDYYVVRENNEGEYSEVGGRMYRDTEDEFAVQESVFTRRGCDRIMRYAFELAARRKKHVTSATKSNGRSEEHTSELQSLMRISYAVFCLN